GRVVGLEVGVGGRGEGGRGREQHGAAFLADVGPTGEGVGEVLAGGHADRGRAREEHLGHLAGGVVAVDARDRRRRRVGRRRRPAEGERARVVGGQVVGRRRRHGRAGG